MTHIVIAGAGIAGLSAALALARVGVRVSLLERRPVLEEAGAGLQLSPNATRCLAGIGVLDAVLPHAIEPRSVRIRRGRDAVQLVDLPLGDAARRRYGAPFLLLHRADLQRTLADAVLDHPGIDLRLGAGVTGIEESGGLTVSAITGKSAVRLEADGFVGAGGMHAGLDEAEDVRPSFSGRTAWRALIPAGRLAASFRRAESNLWLGSRLHMVHYPLRHSTTINVVVILEGGRANDASVDPWAEAGDPALLAKHIRSWHAEPRSLVEAATSWSKWPLFDGSAGLAWSRGRQTLVGDAAHPMLPFLAQGASQAIEDAAALAYAVSAKPDDLRVAFRDYELVRRPAARRVQAASRRQGRIYHLDGAAALARDIAMRALGPRRILARMDWIYRGGDPLLSPDTI